MTPQQEQAFQDLLRWLAGGAAAGAAARFGVGAYAGTVGRPPFSPKTTKPIVVRAPGSDEDEELGQGGPPSRSLGSGSGVKLAGAKAATQDSSEWSRSFGKMLDGVGLGDMWRNYVPSWTPGTGETAETPAEVPWREVGRFLGIPAAAYAGYHMAGPAVSAVQQSRDKSEVDRAREEYYQALAGAVAANRKSASSLPGGDALIDLADAFDAAYDRLEKRAYTDTTVDAGWPALKRLLFPLMNLGPAGAAATLGLAGLSGAVGASHGYNNVRSLSLPRVLTREADRVKAEEEGDPPVVLAIDPKRRVQLSG